MLESPARSGRDTADNDKEEAIEMQVQNWGHFISVILCNHPEFLFMFKCKMECFCLAGSTR